MKETLTFRFKGDSDKIRENNFSGLTELTELISQKLTKRLKEEYHDCNHDDGDDCCFFYKIEEDCDEIYDEYIFNYNDVNYMYNTSKGNFIVKLTSIYDK